VAAEPRFALKKRRAKKEAAGKLSFPGGRWSELGLELVAQCELHHARIGQQSGVVTEVATVG